MDITPSKQYIIHKKDEPKRPEQMTRYEIIGEQFRTIKNWKPRSDVWPLIFGRSILVGTATLTAIYINHRFRARLKLRDYGTVPTMMGITLVTSTVTTISHSQLVMNKLMLLEIPCPLCLETRSALAQTCSGLLVPLIVAPAANFSIAAGSGAYNVPYITDIRKIFSTILSTYKPLFPTITVLFTFNALLAGFITYLEIKSFLRMQDLQYLIEEGKKQKYKENDIG